MICGINAACFDSYTRSHLQADGTPKKIDIHTLRDVPRKYIPCVLIYLLTAIGWTPGGSSTVHNDTEYVERNIHNNKNT
jgi:hypothetical protein